MSEKRTKNALSDVEKFRVHSKLTELGKEAVAMHTAGELAKLITRDLGFNCTENNILPLVRDVLGWETRRHAAIRRAREEGRTSSKAEQILQRLDAVEAKLDLLMDHLTRPKDRLNVPLDGVEAAHG